LLLLVTLIYRFNDWWAFLDLKIKVKPSSSYRKEKSENPFMGDSVMNFASLVMKVELVFEDEKIPNSTFPKNIGLPSIPRGAVFVEYPSAVLKTGERALAFGSADGTLTNSFRLWR
jgi:hypothetical protein